MKARKRSNKMIIAIASLIATVSSWQLAAEQSIENKEVVLDTIERLGDKEFADKIAYGVVAVDFYAEWCRPCQILAPRFFLRWQ